MGIYFAGAEYDEIHVAGNEFSGLLARGQDYAPATDSPGTLTLSVTRRGAGGANFEFSVADPDGVRSISAATLTATDGTAANVLGDFSRTNANTFGGIDSRRHNRWRVGTMSVTYVDNTSGESRTVTQDWSV